MSKKDELSDLKKRMEEDQSLPLRKGATQLVFGEGNPDAKIYFLGEGPGYWEDQKGRPFVGQAGHLLDELIESIGLKRENVYISNIVRFRPPENRDPTPEEIEAFQPYIDEEVRIIKPEIIVTLGRFSMNKFLPNTKISVIHGKPRRITWDGREIWVIPMYHPAAALRSSDVMKQLKQDFQVIKKALEEEPKPQEASKKEEPSAKQLELI